MNKEKDLINSKINSPELSKKEEEISSSLIKFLRIISTLRDPQDGCPWDKEQTHQSLRKFMLEEAYETVEALDENNYEKISSELGDVLLQIALHSQIASEAGKFSFLNVVNKISKKMIHRHPHVFGDSKASSSEQVLENWENLKNLENKRNYLLFEKLSDLPKDLPQLIKSQKIGEKCANYNFDWNNVTGITNKVKEEFLELFEEINKLNNNHIQIDQPLNKNLGNSQLERLKQRIGEEVGDCIFSLVQLSRWLGFSAEDLLRETHNRFIDRIKFMEKEIGDLKSANKELKAKAWDMAKKTEKK